MPIESFEERFLEICDAHRAQGRALAFAIILFDRGHPYVRSALSQQHYWDALDERSGRHLSVFSVDVRAPEPPLERRSMYGVVVPSHERITQAIERYFDGLDAATLPCVLFFQVAEGKVVDTAAVTLTAEGLAATYEELEGVIGTAADAVAMVTDENAENAQEIFNLIAAALQDRQRLRGMMRLYRSVRPVIEVASAIDVIRVILRAVAL